MTAAKIDFDPGKNAADHAKHGLWLSDFTRFDAVPIVIEDKRREYGEQRFQAYGRIDGLGHMIVFVLRQPALRLISFRRVREKDMRRYEQRTHG